MSTYFIRMSVLYFLLGTILGVTMGAMELFQYTSVHAHINLVGWVSLAIIGILYKVYPEAGRHKLAQIQFWLHNIGLPLLIAAMVFFTTEYHNAGIFFAAIGGVLIILSVVLLVINVFKRVK